MKQLLGSILRRLGFELMHRSGDPVLAELRKLHETLRLTPHIPLSWEDTLALPAAHANFRHLLALHRIDLLLDIGANQGQFAALARSLGYTGEIISFEPLPRHQATLRAAAQKDGKWRIFSHALGAEPAELALHIFNDDTFSSLHHVNDVGIQRFKSLVHETRSERVSVRRLDDVWGQIGTAGMRRVLLKTDTQGHDLAVLQGAERCLPQIHAVITESALQPIYDGVPTFSEVAAWLGSRGFAVSGMFPISHRPEDLSLIEMDCSFTRTRASVS